MMKRLENPARRLKDRIKNIGLDAKDAVIGGGLLMVGIGFWLIHPSLAFISVGLGLFGLGTGMIRMK